MGDFLEQEQEQQTTFSESSKFNYLVNVKEVQYFMANVLSQPNHIILKAKEMTCEENHKLMVISLFALDEKQCPIHGKPFLEIKGKSISTEFLTFKIKSKTDEITCFSENNKEILQKLDIYDKINLKGIKLNIKTSNQSVFNNGIMIKDIELYEDKVEQKSMLDKELAISRFMDNIPKLNYPENVWRAYKHSLLLPMVHLGINCLTLGDAGTFKTMFGYSIKNISKGAYVDVPKATAPALMGVALKDFSGKYHLEAGLMHVAKNSVLVLDEVEKFDDYSFMHPLNEVIANHHFTYNKGDIKYDNSNFWISLVSFGNPIGTNFYSGTPAINQVEKTFERNREFLSRMHLTWALRNMGFDLSTMMESNKEKEASMEQEISLYIRQAKTIKISDKNISEEAKDEQNRFVEQRHNAVKDLRFARKFKDLCIAEAKLNLSNEVKLSHVKEIEEIIRIQDSLLFDNRI